MDEICQLETSKLLDHIKNRKLNGNEEDLVDMKPLILMVNTFYKVDVYNQAKIDAVMSNQPKLALDIFNVVFCFDT